jgi:putative tryptophan/tyrosine transport system substrate-binding protein
MQRREFIATLAGVVTAPTLKLDATSAQQAEKIRRIGALLGWSQSEPAYRSFLAAFIEELARLGWIDGRNARIEQLWTDADSKRANAFATELVASQAEVILSSTTPATAALHRETTTIPIVFTVVVDPVRAGFVASLPRPGGNITGFVHTEPAFVGKWLNLLKEIVPSIKRAAIMFNPDTAPDRGNFFLGSFEAAARSLAVEPVTVAVHSDAEIETAITALGREQAGLVLMDDAFMAVHFRTVIPSTVANKVPSIFVGDFARNGGLISYGPDFKDIFRRAGAYVDRILRGEQPADLPVQVPTKFETVINLNTAKALGVKVPPGLLATVDEVID